MMKRLWFWLTAPCAYHCKPIGRPHEWKAAPHPDRNPFPICVHCGKYCWWLRGYTMNSGTVLYQDLAAQAVADNSRLVNVPFDSKP